MRIRTCMVCGDEIPDNIALLRDHLESHNPNADGLSCEEVLVTFEGVEVVGDDDENPHETEEDKLRMKYLKYSSRCPHCGSANIEAGSLDICNGEEIYQPVGCLTCKKRWQDVYTLTDVEFDDEETP